MRKYIICLLGVVSLFVVSCLKDKEGIIHPGSSVALNFIDLAQQTCDAAPIGSAINQYLLADKNILLGQISDAKTKLASALTQEAIDEITRLVVSQKNDFLLTKAVDKKPLVDTLVSAQKFYDSIEVGTITGTSTQASKTTYKAAIDAANVVKNSTRVTEKQLVTTLAMINAATIKFSDNIIAVIDVANQVLYYKMDGNAKDEMNLHNGILGKNEGRWAGIGDIPKPAPDRKGIAGKALHFEKGSFISVPSGPDFETDGITFSFWFNDDDYRLNGEQPTAGDAVQYMFSHDFWNGLQIVALVNTEYIGGNEGNFGAYRAGQANMSAWENALVVPFAQRFWRVKKGEWHHVVCTFDKKVGVLYLDGELAKSFPGNYGSYGASAATKAKPFIIGSMTGSDFTPGGPGDWASCFWGSMDDLRVFKKSLTYAEVRYIYKIEK